MNLEVLSLFMNMVSVVGLLIIGRAIWTELNTWDFR